MPLLLLLRRLQVVGHAYVYLEPIWNLLAVEKEPFPIFDSKGQKQGVLILSAEIQVGSPNDDIKEYGAL